MRQSFMISKVNTEKTQLGISMPRLNDNIKMDL